MLDNYKINQKVIYQTIINSVKKNKVSHAYLIELNNDNNGLDLALAISKFLLCPTSKTCCSDCNNCNICHQIDSSNYLELKIIKPDGNFIKKNQIKDLQEAFRQQSIIGKYRIYIIVEAEKLNDEAANSILKFLEEPDDGVIAILLTNNIYQVYNTIKSRCQILKMRNVSEQENISYINKIKNVLSINYEDDNNIIKDNIESIINYYNYLEQNKLKTIVFKNKDIIQQIKNNFDIDNFFKLSIIIYKDILNIIFGKKIEYFGEYEKTLNSIAKLNNEESISQKIKNLINLQLNIKYNVNQNLLFDKLVILFSEV